MEKPEDGERNILPGEASPDGAGRPGAVFTREIRRITVWLCLSGAALAILGGAGLAQAWARGDRSRLALSLLYCLFIAILALVFFLYIRRKKRWYLEVENERLRERSLEEQAENSENVCAVCHKYSPAGIVSCSMCGRAACPDCLREEEVGDELAPKLFCPACWRAGAPFRERMLELEIACDEKRDALTREWREAAARTAAGKTGGEAAETLERFDACLGERFRERIVELELALEREKEAEAAKWREAAARAARLDRTRFGDEAGADEPEPRLDADE